MVILGLNYYFHDSTACIVVNGQLIAAIEEERLNRDKHTKLFPEMAIARCLKMANLNFKDIDHIAVSIQPTHNLGKKLNYVLGHPMSLRYFISHEFVHAYRKQKSFWRWYIDVYDSKEKGPKVHFIPHHYSHTPGSFLFLPTKLHFWGLMVRENGQLQCWDLEKAMKFKFRRGFPHSLGSFTNLSSFVASRPTMIRQNHGISSG